MKLQGRQLDVDTSVDPKTAEIKIYTIFTESCSKIIPQWPSEYQGSFNLESIDGLMTFPITVTGMGRSSGSKDNIITVSGVQK